jgi:hypothetical protein
MCAKKRLAKQAALRHIPIMARLTNLAVLRTSLADLLAIFGAGLGLLFIGFAPSAKADPLQLRPAQPINAGAAPLAPGTYAIPCVADWNGDGKKDLLVGYQTLSKVALYTNSGTDAQPIFMNVNNVQAGGADIQLPSGGCGAPAPWVCDFDHDGKRDLLVGDGGYGYVYFYRNTNTDAAPRLAPGVQLKVGASALTVSLRATPYVHDWDQDGLPDLLCGNGDGYVFFFKNTNTAQAPIYAPGVKVQAGGFDLNLGIRSVVRVFDWDGDGRKDLVCSSDTGVYWCRNTNNNALPMLQPKVALQVPVSGGTFTPLYTGSRMRLDLVDWNNDGVLDIVLGNANGTVNYYGGYRFAFSSPLSCASGQIALQWNSASYLKYNLLAGPSVTNILNVVATNFPSGGSTTWWTNCAPSSPQFYRVRVAE